MSRSRRNLFEMLAPVSEDLNKFAQACRFVPHTQQQWVVDEIMAGSPFVAVKSGQGPGKTALAALIALFRVIRYHNGLVVYTAPSMRQVKDVAFMEIRAHVNRMEPWLKNFFKVDAMKCTVAGCKDWSIQGVTATRSENAAGYHRDGMTVIAEEASGIPRLLMENFFGTLTNNDPLFLQIGNPNTRDCYFFDTFEGPFANKWVKFTFNCEDTAEWHPEILKKRRNLDLLEMYGRESDVYRIRVLGEFPTTDPNTVIPFHLIEMAMETRYKVQALRQINPVQRKRSRQFGIDFARYGGDENTAFRRSGNAIVDQWWKSRCEPIEAIHASWAMQSQADWRDDDCIYVMDATGIGQGVIHNFYDNSKNVVEFHNGGKAWNTKDYENKITEAWFGLANKMKKKGSGDEFSGNVYLMQDRLLLSQLTNRQYYVTKKGKLIVESKDEYEKRGHDSPDRADGVIYCQYDNVAASGSVLTKAS